VYSLPVEFATGVLSTKGGTPMKRTLIIVLTLLVISSVAFAGKMTPDAKFSTEPYAPMSSRVYSEGFEGIFPPAGWVLTMTNPGFTWHQYTPGGEGVYCANCTYDPALVPQLETLSFTHTLVASELHLTFLAMCSYYWAIDPYQNYDISVTVDGVTVWDYFVDHGSINSFEWLPYDIDLAGYGYVGGETVEIAFVYTGVDGAQGGFDAVSVGEEYVPPPAPDGDVCETALVLPSGDFMVTGTNIGFANDYPLVSGSCTGYSATGQDVVYVTNLEIGDELTVLMDTDTDWDDSVYLITDCADPMGSCVIGADAYPDMSTFSFVAIEAGTYYLIVSAYGSGVGGYTISGYNGGSYTAVEESSWGSIKALYR
jgi:hypothetical protein